MSSSDWLRCASLRSIGPTLQAQIQHQGRAIPQNNSHLKLRVSLSAATATFLVLLIGCGDLERLPRLDKIRIGDLVDDHSITRDLQSRLAADAQLAGKIQVETIERVVYLKGTVESNELKQRATEIALKTPRVTKVANNLVVQSSD